jgi:hypothetical protein
MSITIEDFSGDAAACAKILNYFRATSKVDFEHTFLTYSQKSGAYVDNI